MGVINSKKAFGDEMKIIKLSFKDGARYDENGNRVKRPTTNKVPRQNVQHLLIQKQRPNQARPLIKVQKKGYPQQQSSIRSQVRFMRYAKSIHFKKLELRLDFQVTLYFLSQ